MSIDVKTEISGFFSEREIKEMICERVNASQATARLTVADVHVEIEGGHLDLWEDQYSGGRIGGDPTVVPVKFKGFRFSKTVTGK